MPFAPKHPCRHPGCPALTDHGYCEQHAHAKPSRQLDQRRGSSTERGYDAAWQRFRAHYLRRHPLCVDCNASGRVSAATDAHHIRKLREHPELRMDERNIMALCGECHRIRTARGE